MKLFCVKQHEILAIKNDWMNENEWMNDVNSELTEVLMFFIQSCNHPVVHSIITNYLVLALPCYEYEKRS